MKKLYAFTLSEVLIALLVLGIIVAASVPLIMDLTPNKNAIMIKKAYYTTETIIHDLINDTNYYPPYDSNGDPYLGFDNRNEVTSPFDSSKKISGDAKFPCLFASKLNIKEIQATAACNGLIGISTITTNDGMIWYFDNFATAETIEIDVNGKNPTNNYSFDSGKGVCASDDTWGKENCTGITVNKKKFDRISIKITSAGQIKIDDQPEFEKIINGTTKLIGGDD